MPGIPIKMSETPGAVECPAPLLGQHTEEILKEVLGLTAAEVAELKSQKVL